MRLHSFQRRCSESVEESRAVPRDTRGVATVFMLHRFRDDERGVQGTDPAGLCKGLESLRRRRYEFLGLEEVYRRLAGEGPPLRRAVAFTIDDGYYSDGYN